MTTPFKLSWSIDRITVVGETKKYTWIRDDFEVIELDFEQVWMVFQTQGMAEQRGQGWVLLDKYGENIAYAERMKFRPELARIDFNPNKIGKFLAEDLKHFIHRVFDNPHFSRADVACDMFDLPDDFVRQYQIVDPVSFKNVKKAPKYIGPSSGLWCIHALYLCENIISRGRSTCQNVGAGKGKFGVIFRQKNLKSGGLLRPPLRCRVPK